MSNVNLVIALHCEARPFIDSLQLSKQMEISEFPVFANATKTLYLIVSGIGKVNAGAAIAFLHGITGRPMHVCYLNIGIAGSDAHEIGELIWAHKIMDQATGKYYFPTLTKYMKKTCHLITVDTPSLEYLAQTLVDMEAAGFFSVAARLVSQEQIQVVKIISDNAAQPVSQELTKATASELIRSQLPQLLHIIEECIQLSQQEQRLQLPTELGKQFLQRWHFTVYQQHQLRELLRRWQTILVSKDAFFHVQHQANAREVLYCLTAELDKAIY